MLRRPTATKLRIAFPYRHERLSWWRDPARVVVPSVVGIGGKLFMEWNQHRWRSVNEQSLIKLTQEKRETGLITVGNHQCFIDDAFIWHDLPRLFHLKWSQHRWVLGSADVCFHKFLDSSPIKQRLLNWFFCAGRTIPVTHQDGVYQPGLDFAIERLKLNEWINLYPEGQVNKNNEWMRLYWGVGRMIAEVPKTTILPFYHIGLNEVYPPVDPPLERKFHKNKLVTCIWGEPLDFGELVASTKIESFDDELCLIEEITNRIQSVLFDMRHQCEELHRQHLKEEGRVDQLASFTAKLIAKSDAVAKTAYFDQIYRRQI